MTLPASWAGLLENLRPCFRRRGTFAMFTVLATGMVAATGRHTVVGMLAGAGMARTVSFQAACRFFSAAVWDVDALGLAVARLIVGCLLADAAPITVAFDDTLFIRWGRKVHHAFWTHDGAAQGPNKTARGNRWMVAGIVVKLPFATAPVALPVLLRLWAGKGTTTPVQFAGGLLTLITAAFPGRQVHAVGDAAYHGKPLLVPGSTYTTRLLANAVLYDTAPPRTGRRGRPALKGPRLGRPADLAQGHGPPLRPDRDSPPGRCPGHLARQLRQHTRPPHAGPRRETGQDQGKERTQALRPGPVHHRPRRRHRTVGRALRDQMGDRALERRREAAHGRRPGPQPPAQGRRAHRPVRDTRPTLVILWYAVHGHHPDNVTDRRTAQPWYTAKTEPSFEDMLTKLRGTLIAARFNSISPGHSDPELLRDYALACAAADT